MKFVVTCGRSRKFKMKRLFLAELRIENFRIFGEGKQALILALRPGLTALVGENDTGKTAIVEALRLALGTRDQEFFRIEDSDFHQPPGVTERRNEIRICCKFEDLATPDKGALAEHLTYEERNGTKVPVLYVNWKALPRRQPHAYTAWRRQKVPCLPFCRLASRLKT